MRKLLTLWMVAAAGLLITGCGGGDDDPNPTPAYPNPTTPSNPDAGGGNNNPGGGNNNPGGNDDNPGGGGGETGGQKEAVTFTASWGTTTWATDGRFEQGNRISVFAMEPNPGDNRAIIANQGNYATNVAYTYNGSKFVASGTPIEATADQKLYYSVVYPYVSQAANSFDFSVQTDQRTASAYSASMLSTAATDATSGKVVDLKFFQRMAKIEFTLAGTGWTGTNFSAKVVNVFTKANVNLNNQTFVGIGTKGDITCSPDGTKRFKVILPPQTIDSSEKLLVVTMDGVDYALDTQEAIDLQSGKTYSYTLNLTRNGEVVFFNGDINPWNEDERINSVIPEDIQDKMEPYITIYHGVTPPNIEGIVLIDPMAAVYCEDNGYAPGKVVEKTYIRFKNQSMVYNTIDMDEVEGDSYSSGTGAFISGSGNNFSVFFNTVGVSYDISAKTALLISGTKTSVGIANLKYAFVMVEKGYDPAHKLMNVGVFRIFEDQDGMSPYISNWPGKAPRRVSNAYETLWTKDSNTKKQR